MPDMQHRQKTAASIRSTCGGQEQTRRDNASAVKLWLKIKQNNAWHAMWTNTSVSTQKVCGIRGQTTQEGVSIVKTQADPS